MADLNPGQRVGAYVLVPADLLRRIRSAHWHRDLRSRTQAGQRNEPYAGAMHVLTGLLDELEALVYADDADTFSVPAHPDVRADDPYPRYES